MCITPPPPPFLLSVLVPHCLPPELNTPYDATCSLGHQVSWLTLHVACRRHSLIFYSASTICCGFPSSFPTYAPLPSSFHLFPRPCLIPRPRPRPRSCLHCLRYRSHPCSSLHCCPRIHSRSQPRFRSRPFFSPRLPLPLPSPFPLPSVSAPAPAHFRSRPHLRHDYWGLFILQRARIDAGGCDCSCCLPASIIPLKFYGGLAHHPLLLSLSPILPLHSSPRNLSPFMM